MGNNVKIGSNIGVRSKHQQAGERCKSCSRTPNLQANYVKATEKWLWTAIVKNKIRFGIYALSKKRQHKNAKRTLEMSHLHDFGEFIRLSGTNSPIYIVKKLNLIDCSKILIQSTQAFIIRIMVWFYVYIKLFWGCWVTC